MRWMQQSYAGGFGLAAQGSSPLLDFTSCRSLLQIITTLISPASS